MARQQEFNRDKAVNAATKLFWKQGYKNTSLVNLLKVMKIGESSFYNTFKSKHKLYLDCLEHYQCELMKNRAQVIQKPGPTIKRFHNFFDRIFDEVEASPQLYGCLVSNSLTREILANKNIQKYIMCEIDGIKSLFSSIIAEGISKGEVSKDIIPEDSSEIIFTYLHGIFRLSAIDKNLAQTRKRTKLFLENALGA